MDKKGSPIFMKMKVQGRGFKRKTSLGLVCGIALTGMFLGANGASADEVKAPTDAKPVATATTETPKATTTEAPKQEVQAETKEAPKTEEVKDQAGLDKKYSDLKEQGKKFDVELTEDKKVTHKTVADASKDLDEQGKKVEELAKGRDEANAELQKVVKEAKALGIDVKLDEKVMYDDLDKAKEDIAKQVKELSALVTSVKEGKARLDKAVTTAQSVGVKFEGVKNIDLKEGNLEALAKEIADAEKTLNDVASQQKTVNAELNKAIADAKAKGVNVTVEGEVVVDAKDAQKALAEAKAKIAKALADAEAKNKTIRENNAKVNEANKNAKAELVNGSTANKNADGTYTQTLAVKNEKAGSKWSGNVANTGSAEIVSVKLVSPSGKETVFANAEIDSSKTLDEVGEYKLVYTFKAKDNNAGNISGKLSVEGQAGQTGKATGNITFETKAPISTNTENQIEPLTTVHVYDYSSSYAGKVKDSLRLSKKIIEANKNPDSKHILQLYPDNYGQTSYHASTKKAVTDATGLSSTLLTKQEALEIIDNLLKINAPSEKDPTYQNYGQYFQGLANAMGAHRYVKDSPNTSNAGGNPVSSLTGTITTTNENPGFEEVVEELTKPSDTVSVIQYTDGWMDKGKPEEMDRSFATWAKRRAKTFMSVVNRNQVTDNDTNSNRSIEQMKELGHPNIYDMTGKDKSVVDAEVVKQFMETATERIKVSKGDVPTVNITISGNGVVVTKATLKGASNKELAISNGKVEFSEKLVEGNYVLEYEVTGNGTATAVVKFDGKEVSKKSVEVKSTAGSKGSSNAKEDKLQPSKLGSTTNEVKPEAVKVAKITLKAQKPQVAKVEAKAHEVSVSAKVHPVDVEQKPVVKQTAKVLPSTGSTASVALAMAGVGMLSLAGASLKKKKD